MNLHIFYNGTDSNFKNDFEKKGRFIHGEIVSRFGHYAEKENANVLRINGVGDKIGGTAFGVNMRADITKILDFVMTAKNEILHDNECIHVNLMGWSRGGIGCIYAAHMLSKIWDTEKPNVKLNIKIISFDPVSGKGTNFKALDCDWKDFNWKHPISTVLFSESIKWWELPEHVTEFHGFYAHDERSIGFAATMPTMTGEVKNRIFKLYEVPGTHSTLVGNLYPNGGDTGEEDSPDPVGLHIYHSVVKKTLILLNTWNMKFDNSINEEWITPLYKDKCKLVVKNSQSLAKYKESSQKIGISLLDNLQKIQSNKIIFTDGRGIFIGANRGDRKWRPDSTLTEFLNEKNSKNFLDRNKETKLQKLGGNVQVHDYNFDLSGWDK